MFHQLYFLKQINGLPHVTANSQRIANFCELTRMHCKNLRSNSNRAFLRYYIKLVVAILVQTRNNLFAIHVCHVSKTHPIRLTTSKVWSLEITLYCMTSHRKFLQCSVVSHHIVVICRSPKGMVLTDERRHFITRPFFIVACNVYISYLERFQILITIHCRILASL